MNLRSLSDQNLLAEIKRLAAQERDVLTKILHHLREVNDRRLFSALKYPSIFEYAVRELKYSEGQAIRRIQAMRAMSAVPEIESKISSGELSLSNVALVQSAYVRSGKTLDRVEMLKLVENKSAREAEKIVGVKHFKELTVDMIGDELLRKKAQAVLGKYAHSKLSFEQVLHKLFDRELDVKQVKPNTKSKPSPKTVAASNPNLQERTTLSSSPQIFAPTPFTPQQVKQPFTKPKRQGCCSNCGSTYALQIDHIHPKAKGGPDTPENLRVLCRSCNQRSAIEHFGVAKLRTFIDPPTLGR